MNGLVVIACFAAFAAAQMPQPCCVSSQFTVETYTTNPSNMTVVFEQAMADYVGLQARFDIGSSDDMNYTVWFFGTGPNAGMMFYDSISTGCISQASQFTWNPPCLNSSWTYDSTVTVAGTKANVWQSPDQSAIYVITAMDCVPVYDVIKNEPFIPDTAIFYNFVPSIDQSQFTPCTPASSNAKRTVPAIPNIRTLRGMRQ